MQSFSLKRLSISLLCAVSFLSTNSSAEIYKSVDKQGNVSYSDSPSPAAETIKLPPTPLLHIEPSPGLPSLSKDKQSSVEELSAYQSLSIQQPMNEEALQSGSGELSVALSVQPDLSEDDVFVLTIDGHEVYKGRASAFTLNEIARGSHSLQARIVNKQGQSLIQSKAVIFHLQRPSVLFRPNPSN